ncbi:hypothetical protein [Bacillus mycoides]|uniref:hypothetical protein n=1 Tax=Bacillus mycoides TaxID=1405 RepID=UPI0011ED489A|nr:hypothetical protein [Bacillus mycoides]QEL88195.1 hypothetical protein DN409_28205 [Bacillus mycoides]
MNKNLLDSIYLYDISLEKVQQNHTLVEILEILYEYGPKLLPTLELRLELTFVSSVFMNDYDSDLVFTIRNSRKSYDIGLFSLMFRFNHVYPLHLVYEDVEDRVEDKNSLKEKLSNLFGVVFKPFMDENYREANVDQQFVDEQSQDSKGVELKIDTNKVLISIPPNFNKDYYHRLRLSNTRKMRPNIRVTEELKTLLEKIGVLDKKEVLPVVDQIKRDIEAAELLKTLYKNNLVDAEETRSVLVYKVNSLEGLGNTINYYKK